MELEMWRRVLLVLMVVGNGLGASGNNQDVFEKLCRIAGNVSALMGNDNVVKSPLKEALYGGNGEAHFDEDGTFRGGCGLWHHARSQYCSHMGPNHHPTNGHGCFADSLAGTFFCLCVKGNGGEKDLCRLGNNLGDGAGWTSWDSPVNSLLPTVWDAIPEKVL
ncbi:unnamed protein product [Trypanosoma congolense IL3000]|uniref:WGS project CAEQ00000000 data, annotated contig 499 n=1 Tax=Trypanosoma congolense (strain IL3000) TaxID=1068625 RepID=F9WGG2_TRYCI|nr:unnamed protein product [Trypanosoma congolense IL3000]